MKKSIKYFFGAVSIGALIFLVVAWKGVFRNEDNMMNKLSLLLFDQNHFYFETKGVTKEQLTLKWKTEIEKRDIVLNGQSVGSISNVKGPNVFLLLHNGRPINLTYQSKVAWWHTNDYYYYVERNGDSITCTLQIAGPPADIKELPLHGASEF